MQHEAAMIYLYRIILWLSLIILWPCTSNAQMIFTLEVRQDKYKLGDTVKLKLFVENRTPQTRTVCRFGPACIDRAWVSRDEGQATHRIPPFRTVSNLEETPLLLAASPWVTKLNPGEKTTIWFPVAVDTDDTALIRGVTTLVDRWYCVPGGSSAGIHEPAYATDNYRLDAAGRYNVKLRYDYGGGVALSNAISFTLEK
jgi:hypothetical protein